MIMQFPLVSVIVPAYNQAEFLPETLESVLSQRYPNWECVIVDDGSADESFNVAQSIADRDSRFKAVRIANSGVSAARNTAIGVATGHYILPLDGDDKIAPDYISELVKAMEEDPSIKVAYGSSEKFGLENGAWELADFTFDNLILSNMIHCCGLFRKADFDAIGGYDTAMHEGLEDWEFWINFLKEDGIAKKVESAHFYYRVKSESRMTRISLQKRYRLLAYLYYKHSNYYESFLENPDKRISIDFAYGFWLSAQTYFRNDRERFVKIKKYYKIRLKKELSSVDFFTKKKILFHWYRRGKLNFSLWDVLIN
ncbi:MAG: glycosyltransferase family 2 protein [Flavobacterium sp.]|nr:MAG: glycosyltransferase family 2 protein [Flavobacterium sp.]